MRAVRKNDIRHKILARLNDYAVRINNGNLFAIGHNAVSGHNETVLQRRRPNKETKTVPRKMLYSDSVGRRVYLSVFVVFELRMSSLVVFVSVVSVLLRPPLGQRLLCGQNDIYKRNNEKYNELCRDYLLHSILHIRRVL